MKKLIIKIIGLIARILGLELSLPRIGGYIDVVLGLQWGDEGKGKIVDFLAKDYDIVARFQGGPNAGHTLWYKNKKLVLHNLPSGILHDKVWNFIGPGCIVNPTTLLEEIKQVSEILGLSKEQLKERIFISKNAFIIHPLHQHLDKAIECSKGTGSVGTTGKGIGPAYAAIKDRINFRFGDVLLNEKFFKSKEYDGFENRVINQLAFYNEKYGYELVVGPKLYDQSLLFEHHMEELKQYVTFVDIFWLQNQLDAGKDVLAEGAQGTMLDNNFGCYPMVTSSNTIAGAAPIGLGVPMKYFGKTIGVAKWYTTKVGGGMFPSKIDDEAIQTLMREAGGEVGATTGRNRDIGWLDIPQLLFALRINAVDELIITKVDINPLNKVQILSSYCFEDREIDAFPFDISEIGEHTALHGFESWTMPENGSILNTNLKPYLEFIQHRIERNGLSSRLTMISCGPNRDDIIAY
jgi:adenylosuccinate synthase